MSVMIMTSFIGAVIQAFTGFQGQGVCQSVSESQTPCNTVAASYDRRNSAWDHAMNALYHLHQKPSTSPHVKFARCRAGLGQHICAGNFLNALHA